MWCSSVMPVHDPAPSTEVGSKNADGSALRKLPGGFPSRLSSAEFSDFLACTNTEGMETNPGSNDQAELLEPLLDVQAGDTSSFLSGSVLVLYGNIKNLLQCKVNPAQIMPMSPLKVLHYSVLHRC